MFFTRLLLLSLQPSTISQHFPPSPSTMLDGTSSPSLHRLQNLTLILLSLLCLPLDSLVLLVCYAFNLVIQSGVDRTRSRHKAQPGFKPYTILVTGVGMTKGLALIRLFYEAGHTVIGADFEPHGALACGRFSRSLARFYRLSKPTPKGGFSPYIQSLLDIITKEKVDLWVSCSGVASAVEDGEAKEIVEARTACKAVQFDVKMTQILHEKNSFIQHTSSLSLTAPETHMITNPATAMKILRDAPADRKYVTKTIGVVDAVRADMTLLPKSTPQATEKHIARLPISEDIPWILQQYIDGREYCTHALVIKGQVKAFVACPSAELLMHYEALPAQSPLSKAMLKFTETFARHGGESFTGHLSFDFMVENGQAKDVGRVVLYPIECNPRAHTAVALFNRSTDMVDAYLSLVDYDAKRGIATPVQQYSYYWVGHDLVTRVFLPALDFLLLRTTLSALVSSYRDFVLHILFWRDGTFEIWDPLPWWWLYHVYWPMRFLSCIQTGSKWSRLNVSTTKMFEC